MLNKKTALAWLATIAAVLILPLMACDNDKLAPPMVQECEPVPVYDVEVRPIIDATCAIPACHDNSGGAPGNFTTYENMLTDLNDGDINREVITEETMPIAPGELTVEDRQILRCWLENGFPKN